MARPKKKEEQFPPRDVVRHAEVAREFERFQNDAGESPISGPGIYKSPWRERMRDGSLGPWYGPATPAAHERELAEYQFKREAGSLWDEEEAAKYGAPKPIVLRDGSRKDTTEVMSYVAKVNYALPERELRVYYGFWVDSKSVAEIARKLGIATPTVREYIRRIRESVREQEAA